MMHDTPEQQLPCFLKSRDRWGSSRVSACLPRSGSIASGWRLWWRTKTAVTTVGAWSLQGIDLGRRDANLTLCRRFSANCAISWGSSIGNTAWFRILRTRDGCASRDVSQNG